MKNGKYLKDLFELKREFLEYCELDKGQSALTVAGYDRYLNKFLEWLKEYKASQISKSEFLISNKSPNVQTINGKINDQYEMENGKSGFSPEDIDQESVRQYRLYINRLTKNGQELKKTTQNYHILALRAFLRYLAFRGIQSLSPEKVSIAKTGDREITFLESEELESILGAPDTSDTQGVRDKAILEILFSTGMRVSELAALNVDDLNFERGEIAVLGKGKKLRVVFLSESAIEAAGQYIGNRASRREKEKNDKKELPLFLSNKCTRLTVRSIERIVKKYSTRAGLAKKVSPHTLRHSFATDLLIGGADVRSVQSLLGHSSITTTQVYTHVTDQHLREIHQKFHGKSIKKDQEES